MKCQKCGKRILSTDRICKHCGKRLPRQKKGAKLQISPRFQLPINTLLIAGIVGVFIIIAFVLVILPGGNKSGASKKLGQSSEEISVERGKSSREIAPYAVYGKIMATHIRDNRRGMITVKSLHTGKIYTFYIGWHTSYHPQRYPSIGERVKVYHLNDEVSMKATQVTIEQ